MSYTELLVVPENGPIELYKEFQNSWLGAWYVWSSLYRLRYNTDLTPLRDNMQRVWNLANDKLLPESFRIVLTATFDNVMVKRQNIPRLTDAMNEFCKVFPGGHYQIKTLLEIYQDDSVYAVCWNQTSVNADVWCVYDETEDDECRRYDISKDTGHWFLFDEE